MKKKAVVLKSLEYHRALARAKRGSALSGAGYLLIFRKPRAAMSIELNQEYFQVARRNISGVKNE